MRVHTDFLLLVSLSVAVLCRSDDSSLLARTLNGLIRALDFMGSRFEQMNLDGVLGSRIVTEQLKVILKRNGGQLQQCSSLHPLLTDLKEAWRKAQFVTQNGRRALQKQEPDYYARVGGLLDDGMFGFYLPATFLRPSAVHLTENTPSFVKPKSDFCLADLFGSYGRVPCNVTDDCWHYLTAPGQRRYVITHQVLFLESAQTHGCSEVVEERAQRTFGKTVLELTNDFCYSIYLEAKEFERLGYPEFWQDLLMEQIGLCGILGYRDFYQLQWIEKILSLQDASGCYTRPEFQGNEVKKRRKRDDVRMEGRCSSHKTAVAIDAMAVNLRFLLDDFLANYRCSTLDM